MKKTTKKKLCIIIPAFVLLIAAVCCFAFFNMPEYASEQRLSEEEVAKLREGYPVYGVQVPKTLRYETMGLTLEDMERTLEEAVEQTDHLIYGEVTGEKSIYEAHFEHHYYEYPVSVIADSAGKHEKGEKITVISSVDDEGYYPELTAGMKMVFPVSHSSYHESYFYGVEGLYYVTEDEYVITAFREEIAEEYSEDMTSGVKLGKLFKTFEEQRLKERQDAAEISFEKIEWEVERKTTLVDYTEDRIYVNVTNIEDEDSRMILEYGQDFQIDYFSDGQWDTVYTPDSFQEMERSLGSGETSEEVYAVEPSGILNAKGKYRLRVDDIGYCYFEID